MTSQPRDKTRDVVTAKNTIPPSLGRTSIVQYKYQCLLYRVRTTKSIKTGQFVLRKLFVSSRQKHKIISTKLFVEFELFVKFIQTICLDGTVYLPISDK